MKKIILSLCLLSLAAATRAQEVATNGISLSSPLRLPPDDIDAVTSELEPRHRLKYKIDIPLTAASTIWTIYAFGKIYAKSPSDTADIAALNKNDLNKLDRWAAGLHDEQAAATSDLFFYGSMPLPFFLLLDKKIRRDAPRVGFLYLESMALTGLLYTGTDMLVDRYRPETYRTDKAPGELTSGNNRNSFFAGHVALVGTATFFMAKIYHDYHPHNNWRYVFWGGAIVATGTTAYLRHKAGKHFPTDIVVGTAVGVLSGVLVPELHRNKKFVDRGLGLSPTMIYNKPGVSLTYRFK